MLWMGQFALPFLVVEVLGQASGATVALQGSCRTGSAGEPFILLENLVFKLFEEALQLF